MTRLPRYDDRLEQLIGEYGLPHLLEMLAVICHERANFFEEYNNPKAAQRNIYNAQDLNELAQKIRIRNDNRD